MERPADTTLLAPHSDGSAGFLSVFDGVTELFTVTSEEEGRPIPVLRSPSDGNPWQKVYLHSDPFLDPVAATAANFRRQDSSQLAEVFLTAMHNGAQSIVIGAGHTPWHDAGAGFLWRLAQEHGMLSQGERLRESDGGINPDLAKLVVPLARYLQEVTIVVASSREVPLRGLHGAGAELAQFHNVTPQEAQEIEGLTQLFVDAVDREVENNALPGLLETTVQRASRQPWLGSGGGVAFILSALGAQVRPGAWVTGSEIQLDQALKDVDVVVTGAHTIAGEELGEGVVADVAQRASVVAIPVIVVAGQLDASRRQLFKVGIHAAYPVIDTPASRPQLVADAVSEQALIERGRRLARTWSR